MTKKNLFLISFFVFLFGTTQASVPLSSRMVDSITYHLYQEKRWDSLIDIGKEALHQEIDFFYLRVRMGVAYYEKKKYIVAVEHFSKAHEFNSADTFNNEYLYLALLNANRFEDAAPLTAFMPPDVRRELEVKKSVVEQVHIEAGPTFNPSYNKKANANLMGSEGIYGENDLYGNSFYGNASLTLNLSRRVNLTAGYSYLSFQKKKRIQNTFYTDRLDSTVVTSWGYQNYYSFPLNSTDTTWSYKVRQDELYLASTIRPATGMRIIPYFHLLNVRYTDFTASYQTQTVNDTSYFLAFDSSYTTFPYTRSIYSYRQADTSFYNFVAGISLYQDFSRVTIGLTGSWSNLNNKQQAQAGYRMTWFPLGNINLYGVLGFTGFWQGNDSRLLAEARIGGRIASWLWAEGNLLYGDYTNTNISEGSIVYNNSDKIDYRLGANLTFPLSKHFTISLIYQYFSKESPVLYYTRETVNDIENVATPQVRYQKYSTHSIIGGITWKL
ncbi:MAG: hypothetical protein WCO93_11775 [bacterium]